MELVLPVDITQPTAGIMKQDHGYILMMHGCLDVPLLMSSKLRVTFYFMLEGQDVPL
jgi:hypothetical protein